MIILHEINQLEMGGAERVVAGIIRHDKENQHVIYSYKDGPMRKVFEEIGARVIVDDGETTEDVNPNIIHIHTGGDASVMASCVKNSIPTIETVHSPVVSAVRDQWIEFRVGVSNVVTKMNRKCRTIYNGVDIDRLEKEPKNFDNIKTTIIDHETGKENNVYMTFRENHDIPQNAFVVGRLGRIGFDKCMEEFLIACWLAQKTGLINDMHVVIVGDEAKNSVGHLAKMKVAAASLPLKNVHFVPAIECAGWAYQSMDLFLYPSPSEGFGLVFFEAMACGVPVLTWKTDLTSELLLGAAWLSNEQNSRCLADDLVYLALNKNIRDQLAAEGQKLALSTFTEERMSGEYQKLYAEIAKKRHFYPEAIAENV